MYHSLAVLGVKSVQKLLSKENLFELLTLNRLLFCKTGHDGHVYISYELIYTKICSSSGQTLCFPYCFKIVFGPYFVNFCRFVKPTLKPIDSKLSDQTHVYPPLISLGRGEIFCKMAKLNFLS